MRVFYNTLKNVDDLIEALRNGGIKSSQIPSDYIEGEGNWRYNLGKLEKKDPGYIR